MAIRESLLDALSSIGTSDFVRSVTAAGASSKVTVSNLAKTIIENYTGSTLAGSSRSVKSAIDAINNAIPTTTSETYTNMTVYRYGNIRMVYVNGVDGQMVGTLATNDKPPESVRAVGTVYNGSAYVTAILGISTSGEVTIQGQFGGAISGIQIGFMAPRYIMYLV